MTSTVSFKFSHVVIESMAVDTPPIKVTSAEIEDRLAPVYERLRIPFGTLGKLSGIKSRNFWDASVMPSEAATTAATYAIEKCGFSRDKLGALFSCSVTRDFFEPATACLIHNNLGLQETCMVMDISNACLGFQDGMLLLANLIETGIVKAGVIVSGETISRTLDNAIKHLIEKPTGDRDQFLKLLPMFTLGSGSVAYVLAHDSIATSTHRLVGATTRSRTELHRLCVGNSDFHSSQDSSEYEPIMHTESSKLISSAAVLGGQMWKDLSGGIGWSRDDVDHIFCHQVGKQVNEAFYAELGLDMAKEFTIYKTHGNLASAALPTAFVLGSEEKKIAQGEKIVLTGFGSGLNSVFSGVVW